jgi:hypothetical protein
VAGLDAASAEAGTDGPEKADGPEKDGADPAREAVADPPATEASPAADERPERIPGMDAAWQRPNFSWRSLELGPHGLPDGHIGAPEPPEPPADPDPATPEPPPPPEPAAPAHSREASLDPWPPPDEAPEAG